MDIKLPTRKRPAAPNHSPGESKHRRRLTFDTHSHKPRGRDGKRERTDRSRDHPRRDRNLSPKHRDRPRTQTSTSSHRLNRSSHSRSHRRSQVSRRTNATCHHVSSTVIIPAHSTVTKPKLSPIRDIRSPHQVKNTFPKSPICPPTPDNDKGLEPNSNPPNDSPSTKPISPSKPSSSAKKSSPHELNSPNPHHNAATYDSSSPLLEVPALMTDFDQDAYLDQKKLSTTFFHILNLTKFLNKTIYTRFAQILKEEGFIKQN